MPKMNTPAMQAYAKKHRKPKKYSAAKEAWKRLCRNRTAVIGLVIVVFLVLMAIFANIIAPYGYQEQISADAYQGPTAKHLFGTDNFGRDLFSRCVFGARYTLFLGMLCVITATLTGGFICMIAGYFGGKTDNIIMRFMDVLQAIPSVLLAICISSALGNGVPQLVTAITISSMPIMSKNFRAAIINVKTAEYVESSKAIGVGRMRMLFKHMIPNAIGVMIIYVVGMMSTSISVIASLSYLGVGLNPPAAEWGLILSESKAFFTSFPYMLLFPAGMIALATLSLNMLGDGLRDAFDPKLK